MIERMLVNAEITVIDRGSAYPKKGLIDGIHGIDF